MFLCFYWVILRKAQLYKKKQLKFFFRFDAIATTGEEVQNAKRTIPLSIIITLIIVSISYSSVSAILTLMIPYYVLDVETPITQAFEFVGFNWAKYIVSIGAIASLASW